MLPYASRYEDREFSSISAIDLVLKYAPLLLDLRALDAVEQLLDDCRRIHRKSSEDLPAKVVTARESTRNNHRLWGHIERDGEILQDELQQALGGREEEWRAVLHAWTKMGLLRRTAGAPYRVSLATRMGQIVRAKCSSCGHIDEAPKSMFLEKISCPKCRSAVPFVLLAARNSSVKSWE
jgi:hypothetical protein